MSETSTTDSLARGRAFVAGLNPYGLTYHLGLQGAGGPRTNPNGVGLEGFIATAIELGARAIEIFDPWLRALSDDELAALRDRLAELRMVPIVSQFRPDDGSVRQRVAIGAGARRFDHSLRSDHGAVRRPPSARGALA